MNHFEFHSVGQGLFYTGSLMNKAYNFVFDCGTDNKKIFVEKEIDKYFSFLGGSEDYKPNIEFVVISHLHRDHFKGLIYLLKKFNVKKIYLPYLSDDETIILSILILSIFNYESDNYNPEDDWMLFELMCALYGIRNDSEFVEYTARVFYINEMLEQNHKGEKIYFCETFYCTNKGIKYWQFNLIQSSVTKMKLSKLYNAILTDFGAIELKDLPSKMDKKFLNKLSKTYESVFGKGNALNLTSIILIHFPLYNPITEYYDSNLTSYYARRYLEKKCLFDFCHFRFLNCHSMKFLNKTHSILTGDALIDGIMASKIRSISPNKENFILQVPHHGAKDNWKSIRKNIIESEVYIISFGYGNTHSHPHVNTIDDLIFNDEEFYCVTQKESFTYVID